MRTRLVVTAAAFAAMTLPGYAQSMQKRADYLSGADRGQGKCTAEVVVDGAAEVEIRGDVATLRNLNGQPPQWRRFVCTGPLPANAPNFRFAGVDGRGRQELVRDPRNGGSAVIRIEDTDNGSEGYTFDVFWGGNAAPPRQTNVAPIQRPNQEYDRRGDQYDRPRDGDRFRNDGALAGVALESCRNSVTYKLRQDGYRRIDLSRINVDDRPGRNDWIIGDATGEDSRNRLRTFTFSCSVNLRNGELRTVDVVRRR